jgi:hypothetical protein
MLTFYVDGKIGPGQHTFVITLPRPAQVEGDRDYFWLTSGLLACAAGWDN